MKTNTSPVPVLSVRRGNCFVACFLAFQGLLFTQIVNSRTIENIATGPAALYGSKIYYTIKRNGKKIGQHSIAFEQQEQQLKVSINSALTVTILKIPVPRLSISPQRCNETGTLGFLEL